jgi:mRNA-degrading endonuclease toxin of MazEF toxin-antitoxin module
MHHDQGGRLEVWGTDHERVRKVYGDRRALIISDDAFRAQREVTG